MTYTTTHGNTKVKFGTKYELQAAGEHCVIRNFMILRPTSTKYLEGPLLGTLKDT